MDAHENIRDARAFVPAYDRAPETDSAPDALETDTTDETYCATVTNDEFLSAIFGELASETRPVVCGFTGDPNKGSCGKWFGRPWVAGKSNLSAPALNQYFSLASFRPDPHGKYRRQKKHFAALHAIVLDDIGAKVAGLDRLTLPPSWLLETSAGNYQAGYILAPPVSDHALAERLMKAIIAANLCDPGAGGPMARLMRLPIGINAKHSPPFECCLREWHPERRYTPEQIGDGLQIDMSASEVKRRPARAASPQVVDDGDEVFTPRALENPVLSALRRQGLYKSPLGTGRHDITCPWVNEHTDGADHGTAYFEPDSSYPLGGFKCQHGHCAERHVSALLKFLEVTRTEAKHRPTIRITAGALHQIADAAERELAGSGHHYQRGGIVVVVTTDPATRETNVKAISPPSLARALSNRAIWERFDRRGVVWVPCDPPERHVRVLFDSDDYPHLPVLNGLARQPYLRPDGSLMTRSGYDHGTGMFGVFAERDYSIPAHPTRKDAEPALAVLIELLGEFRFVAKHDRAAALAGILTAVIRPALPLAPMFHVRAPQISSGKTYLCELFTAFATPQRGSPTTFPRDDEECRKLLLAELMTAPPVIEFDNLTSDLVPHKSLCSALTSEFISGRILGVSKTATPGTRALFLSSGNNVGPVGDMTRRALVINLDPACETPAARSFHKQPVADVQRERGRYVSLALTIVRAWIEAGRPRTEVKPLASYTFWSDLCRQPLLWLSESDPATSVFEVMEQDPDRESLAALLHAWQRAFGNKPMMVRDAVRAADEYCNDDLRDAMLDLVAERDGSINRRRLGRWIARHAKRTVDGIRFEKDSGSRSAEAWAVKSVSSVSSVSSALIAKTVISAADDREAYARASRSA